MPLYLPRSSGGADVAQISIDSNASGAPNNIYGPYCQTHASTAHTAGAWTTIIASTAIDSSEVSIYLQNTFDYGVQTDQLIDFAIGAAAAEVQKVWSVPCGWLGTVFSGGRHLVWPWHIPAGVRVAGRVRGLILSDAVWIGMALHGSSTATVPGVNSFDNCEAVGAVTASSQGTSHTPGNTNAFSSWTDFGSPTAREYKALQAIMHGTMSTTAMNTAAYHIEVGAASTAFGGWNFDTTNSECVNGPWPHKPVVKTVAASTQLQIRAKCNGTAQAMDCVVMGFW